MKKILTILFVSILTIFSPVQAANDLTTYVGIHFGSGEADDGFDEVDVDYGMFRLGIMPTDNTALEYRIGTGTSDDKLNGVSFEVENIYGLYGLYHYYFSENSSVYGVAGFSKVSLKASLGDASTQFDENGFSYGVGAELYGFNLEYMQYLDTTDLEVGVFAIGYNYKFN